MADFLNFPAILDLKAAEIFPKSAGKKKKAAGIFPKAADFFKKSAGKKKKSTNFLKKVRRSNFGLND